MSNIPVDLFERYCRQVARDLGDLMPFVCTVNEPQMVALHSYLEGYHPPGHTSPILWRRAGRCCWPHTTPPSARSGSARATRESGLTLQLPYLTPARADEACQALHRVMRGEIVDRYLDGLTRSDPGDFVGVQYYRKLWVDPSSPTRFAEPPPGYQRTQLGWAVRPDGLRHMLHRATTTGLGGPVEVAADVHAFGAGLGRGR